MLTQYGHHDGPANPQAGDRQMAALSRIVLGVGLLLFGIVLLYLLVTLWPAVTAAQANAGASVTWFWRDLQFTADTTLLMLVVLVSALGSYVHVTVSFSDFAGNRQLATSWVWWYLLRAFVGSSLAVLFYFAVRGGFFASASETEQINVYGMAALAGLVGLFSKQATDKLREIFDTAFKTGSGYGDETRGDSVSNPKPTIERAVPMAITNNEDEITLVGTGFGRYSSVTVRLSDGREQPREVLLLDDTHLKVTLQTDDIEAAGTLAFWVVNADPGGGTSNVLLVVVAPKNGVHPQLPEHAPAAAG